MPRILVSIILFILTILIVIFLLWPGYLKFQNLQAQIKNKEVELQYKGEYYKELSSLQEKLNNYQEEFSKIDSALPSELSLPSFYNFLQKVASENGLVLESIGTFSTKNLAEKTDIKETSLNSVKLVGSYSSFKNFLTALEKNSRMISIEDISFSTPQEGESFDFDITMKIYSY